jgi:hypothetical protein
MACKMNSSSEDMEGSTVDGTHPRLRYLLPYFACYCLTAAVTQAFSEIPPWEEGAPMDFFTAGLLWMLSLIGLLMADSVQTKGVRSTLWLAASAGLALLALDELFGFHEQTSKIVGNDDHIKVLQWFAAGGAMYLINRFEVSSFRIKTALVTGFIVHGFYILVDVGDGDYFTMPLISVLQLKWMEEYFELFALTAYCVGLLCLYTGTRGATVPGDE